LRAIFFSSSLATFQNAENDGVLEPRSRVPRYGADRLSKSAGGAGAYGRYMAKLKTGLRSWSRNVRLTADELVSLRDIANRPMQRTIPDEHRTRLLTAGYVREIIPAHGGVSALALTGRGLRRLATEK
jgi:hypothetical protein